MSHSNTRRGCALASALAVSALSVAACAPALAQTAAPAPAPASSAATAVAWGSAVLRQPAAWYATSEARRLADNVILYQSPNGSWPKNTDMAAPPAGPIDQHLADTIDNQATTLEMGFLARVIEAGGAPARSDYVAAFDRGYDWLLAAQYPSGGWPQFFPLRGGYYDHITYNDDAMVRVLTLLRDVADGKSPYGFVDAARKEKAADAVARGVDIILKTQIRQDGELTVWCAQHDEITLAPAWARKFEPPSLSGYESVGITRFLMGVPNPSPEVIAAIEGSVAWFKANAISDIAVERFTDAGGKPDRRVIPAPGARLWARFYELDTNRPVFIDRTSVLQPALADLEQERRAGYNYYDGAAAGLIDKDYPAWRARVGPAS